MVTLQCYEPAGTVLKLSAETLLRHVLILGSTGCGKTSGLISPILDDLISFRSDDRNLKNGLLILDPKEDDTVHRVMLMAGQAGRSNDVTVLSVNGNAFLDLMGGFRRLTQVEDYVRLFLSGTNTMGVQNQYFEEMRNGLVSSALTIMLANGSPVSFSETLAFIRACLLQSDKETVAAKLDFVKRLIGESRELSEATRQKLQLAITDLEVWESLDRRGKSIHQTSILNVLRPLMNPAAGEFFTPKGRQECRLEDALHGRIVVVSCNAQAYPELASLIFKVAKDRFYQALYARGEVSPEERLCFIVSDEFGLICDQADVENVATARSRGCGMIAATQSLAMFDQRIGYHQRSAFTTNINSYFFMQSRADSVTDVLAFVTMGSRTEKVEEDTTEFGSQLLVSGAPNPRPPVPVFNVGTLASLPPHHAFATLADGTRTLQPVWLVPQFYPKPDDDPATDPEEDDLARAVKYTKGIGTNPATTSSLAEQTRNHFATRGVREQLTTDLVMAACDALEPRSGHKRNYHLELIASLADKQIKGLESIPSCWLAGILAWFRPRITLSVFIDSIQVEDGLVCVRLTSLSTQTIAKIMINNSVNRLVYPNLWRPLKRNHFLNLWVNRPELRPQLEQTLQAICVKR